MKEDEATGTGTTMARLSRAESQERTRSELLAVATKHFLERGYVATSLEQISEDAGYSKGAVYSNFTSKDELCLAVLEGIQTEKAGEIVLALAAGGTLDERLAALANWAERTLGDVGWSALGVEFVVRCRHDERLREKVADTVRHAHELIAASIAALAEEMDLELVMPARDAAVAILSLGLGLGLQRAVDPRLEARVFTETIRALTGRKPSGT